MKIKRSKDCGNSPKNQRAETLFLNLVRGDWKKIKPEIPDEVSVVLTTGELVRDIDSTLGSPFNLKLAPSSSLQVLGVTSHGRFAAVNGYLELNKKDQCYLAAFFEFTSAGAKTLKSVQCFKTIK